MIIKSIDNDGLVIKKYDYLKFKKSIIEEYLLLQEKYSKIYNKDKTGASIHQAALQYLQELDNVERVSKTT